MSQTGSADNRWRVVVDILALVGPVTLLSGILYYFGYVSARSFYAYFGISLSILEFSPASYLVRSADTFFRPVATVLVVILAVYGGHRLLAHYLGRAGPRRVRLICLAVLAVGVALGALGVAGLYGWALGLVSPLSLACGGLLVEYALLLLARHGKPVGQVAHLVGSGVYLRRGLLAALVLTAVFWAVTTLAQRRGADNAELTELTLVLQPQAVVYSDRDLHLPGPGVGRTVLDDGAGSYRFRYNGLRPLLHANDRWFLLPVHWRHDNGSTVIVLPDEPGRVRVDLAP
ncbi:hypothetical protein [Actinophytocola sediminis]